LNLQGLNVFGEIKLELNETLCADFTDEEMSFALFQIGPMKVPGPHGTLKKSFWPSKDFQGCQNESWWRNVLLIA
jgi:hypothetical protein